MTSQELPTLSFVKLSGPRVPHDIFPNPPYSCIVILRDAQQAELLREPLSKKLVESRCSLVSFQGAGAEAFEDSVDWANIDVSVSLPPETDFVVITTAHADEPLEDVANMVAHFRVPTCSNCLVLGIGSSSSDFEEVRSAFAAVV